MDKTVITLSSVFVMIMLATGVLITINEDKATIEIPQVDGDVYTVLFEKSIATLKDDGGTLFKNSYSVRCQNVNGTYIYSILDVRSNCLGLPDNVSYLDELRKKGVVFQFDSYPQDFSMFDLVVRSPGVSVLSSIVEKIKKQGS